MPREHDVGYALHLAQRLRVFVQKPERIGESFRVQERRGQPPVFEARHVVELTRYLQARLAKQ